MLHGAFNHPAVGMIRAYGLASAWHSYVRLRQSEEHKQESEQQPKPVSLQEIRHFSTPKLCTAAAAVGTVSATPVVVMIESAERDRPASRSTSTNPPQIPALIETMRPG
jgi:hypothetical protein